MSLEPCAASIDIDPEPGTPAVRERQAQPQHDQRRRGGVRGLEISPRSFRQNHLVQCQVGDGAPKPRVLGLKLLPPLDLVALQATLFGPPTVIRYFRHAYRSDRLCDRSALRTQHINLPKLRDDLFRTMSLSRHPSVLHRLKSHTSGRTTFQGADHALYRSRLQ